MSIQSLAQALTYRDSQRAQAKACIGIDGMSGGGKSGLALAIAYILADKDWQKTYALDTENKSLDLFDGLRLHTGDPILPFKKLDLLPIHGYAPRNYVMCKENAIKAGALSWVCDSASHMWQMEGGVLQRVDELARANKSTNKFNAWGTDEIVAEKNAIYNVIRDDRIHIISTIRTKRKHAMTTVDGKTTVISLGEQDVFMPDFDFEFDLLLRMESPGNMNGTAPIATVTKTRYAIFQQGESYEFNEPLLMQLKAYLAEGADPEELKEQQRQELIIVITKILDTDVSKATMFPLIKEQHGLKDTKLADMKLSDMKTIFGILVN